MPAQPLLWAYGVVAAVHEEWLRVCWLARDVLLPASCVLDGKANLLLAKNAVMCCFFVWLLSRTLLLSQTLSLSQILHIRERL